MYIVAFASGVLKVGHALDVDARVQSHVKVGAVHGNAVVDVWVSPPHAHSASNERLVLDFCLGRGELASGGRRGEYFAGIPFEAAKEFAESLSYGVATPVATSTPPIEVSFSELLQKPRETAAKVKAGRGLKIKRRDGEDLHLGVAADRDASLELVRALILMMSRITERSPEGSAAVQDAALRAFPWAQALPLTARQEFVGELLSLTEAGASLGLLEPSAAVIAAWRSTAQVYADPELLATLTSDHGDDDHGDALEPQAGTGHPRQTDR
ncbi:hypothetical protein [Streptomyces microflavus]|uniref:hypothetical protein n=1 Tax=Streptomyces microflavus TaxID=1919 RepID=UPI0013BC0CEC|nr:hypothetical protein [Streptomyces microflavus]NEE44127.1 hypothetical protein [Streptomyces sp. SID8455]